MNEKAQSVSRYYSRLGSRLGYLLVMRRSQHFGYYDAEHDDEISAQANYHDKFTELLKVKSSDRILDAGCGQGVVATYIASNHKAYVTGVTVVEVEARNAQKRAQNYGVAERTEFLVADYHRLPFADASFDLVYTTESLSHAYDLKAVVSEFLRVLKPGGSLVCAEYEFDVKRLDEESSGPIDFIEKYAAIHGARQFDRGNFKKLMSESGFLIQDELDWTKALYPSFVRLRRVASLTSGIVRKLGLRKRFPNVIAASMYADGVDEGVFWYKVYQAKKGTENE